MPRPPLLLLLLLCAPAAAGAAEPAATGEWEGPIGRVRIAADGPQLRGTLVAPAPGCGLAAGAEVLRGSMVDDSLAGQVRVCLSGKGCPADEWATALLLVGSDRLTGAVHLARKECRAPLGKSGGLTLRRPRAAARAAPPPPPPRKPGREAHEKAVKLLQDGGDWLAEGNAEKARDRFLEALELDPTIPEAYNGVGVTWRVRNDLAAALDWYKRALAIDPDFGDAYYNMACAYALQGERTLALRYLQIAAMNGYRTAEGMDGDSDLASLRTTREYRALRDRM